MLYFLKRKLKATYSYRYYFLDQYTVLVHWPRSFLRIVNWIISPRSLQIGPSVSMQRTNTVTVNLPGEGNSVLSIIKKKHKTRFLQIILMLPLDAFSNASSSEQLKEFALNFVYEVYAKFWVTFVSFPRSLLQLPCHMRHIFSSHFQGT